MKLRPWSLLAFGVDELLFMKAFLSILYVGEFDALSAFSLTTPNFSGGAVVGGMLPKLSASAFVVLLVGRFKKWKPGVMLTPGVPATAFCIC